MEKVYCENCKYYIHKMQRQIIDASPLCTYTKIDSFYDKRRPKPWIRNKNNNCKYFVSRYVR